MKKIERLRIQGVVEGTSGFVLNGPGLWSQVIFLWPWRHVGGEPQKTSLRLLLPALKRKTLSKWQGNETVSLQGQALKPKYGLPSVQAMGTPTRIPKLRSLKAPPRMVVPATEETFRHATLGLVTYDRRHDCFTVPWKIGNRARKITIEASWHDEATRDRNAARIATQLARMEGQTLMIRARITKKMLPLYNETWRGERARRSASTFSRSLALRSITFSEGEPWLTFSCRDLFFDHAIQVELTKSDGVKCISLI
jgi:hypothetical protein